MNTLEMLTRENQKLEREIEQLEFSNAILSRLFYYAAKKLGKYSVPFRYEPQDGKIDFRKIGDIVEVKAPAGAFQIKIESVSTP